MSDNNKLYEDVQCDEYEYYDEIEQLSHHEPHELIQMPDGMLMCQLCGIELTPTEYMMFKEPYYVIDEPTTRGISLS
jgi:hypothetical protein